jgi:hypothetical protein
LGLYYLRARYFSPLTGRFLSTDPADAVITDPGTLHKYTYASADPVNRIDPTGWQTQTAAAGGGAITPEAGGVLHFFIGPLTWFKEQFHQYGCPAVMWGAGPEPPKNGHDPAKPFGVGVEWLTGCGQRVHHFSDGDPFTEMLRRHDHIQNLVADVCSGKRPQCGEDPYYLGGFGGVPKYIGDYSTIGTGGLTGNLAVTYLGSYELSYCAKNGVLHIHVVNCSTISSATHPPVIGYTPWWNNHIGGPLDRGFSTGPMSKTTQIFDFNVDLKKSCSCRN